MTHRMPTAQARKGFASVLRSSAAGERIKLTRYNKTVAVIIPKWDLVELEGCEKQRSERAGGEHAPAKAESQDRADSRATDRPHKHEKSDT